jgi:hypothetical protein
MRNIIYSAIILSQLITLTLSCTCPPIGTIEEEFNKANSVFLGAVLDIKTQNNQNSVTFYILDGWKGVNGDQVNVVTAENSAACGFNFEKDKTYVVYGSKNGQINVTICSRTATLSDSLKDIEELDKLGE